VPGDEYRGPIEAWVADLLLRESAPPTVLCSPERLEVVLAQETRLLVEPDGGRLRYTLVGG
jgi:hypothetical protein